MLPHCPTQLSSYLQCYSLSLLYFGQINDDDDENKNLHIIFTYNYYKNSARVDELKAAKTKVIIYLFFYLLLLTCLFSYLIVYFIIYLISHST